MAGWIPLPSSLQKRFLSYALLKTGIFDENALNLDNLNLTWGRQNVVELQDIALSIPGISKLVELPSELRLTAAKALSLRLTVPADILRSTIVFDLGGIQVDATYDAANDDLKEPDYAGIGSRHTRTPAHRKTTQRIPSLPSNGSSSVHGFEDEGYGIAVQDMARSFLLERPLEERQELEESVATTGMRLDDSMSSASSETSAVGTGGTLGLPAFLASFLQGVVDRVEINLKDISVLLTLQGQRGPMGFHLIVDQARVWSVPGAAAAASSQPQAAQRNIDVHHIALEILQNEFPTMASRPVDNLHSPTLSQRSSPVISRGLSSPSVSTSTYSAPRVATTNILSSGPRSGDDLSDGAQSQQSIHTTEADRYADVEDNGSQSQLIGSELDIRPGEDNISWGSRRTQMAHTSQDMWNSVAESDDLPDSLLLQSKRRLLPSLPSFGSGERDRLSSDEDDITPALHGSVVADPFASLSTKIRAESEQTAPSWQTGREEDADSLSRGGGDHQPFDSTSPPKTLSPPSAAVASSLTSSRSASVLEQNNHGINETDEKMNSTHQDTAESMYMSTLTHDSPTSVGRSRLDMPGGWMSELNSRTEPPSQPVITDAQSPDVQPDRDHMPIETSRTPDQSGVVTPRAVSPEMSKPARNENKRHNFHHSMPLMDISGLRLTLTESAGLSARSTGNDTAVSGTAVPAYKRRHSHHEAEGQAHSATQALQLRIAIASWTVALDVPTIQLLLAAMSSIRQVAHEEGSDTRRADVPALSTSAYEVVLEADLFHIDLSRELTASTSPSTLATDSPRAVRLALTKTRIVYEPDRVDLAIRQFVLLNCGRPLFRFQDEAQYGMTSSTKVASAIEMSISSSKADVAQRTFQEVEIVSQVLEVDLDVDDLIRTTSTWGDLSELLDIRSSPSYSASGSSPTHATEKSAGVRFEEPYASPSSSSELKVNVRLAGCLVNVRSKEANLTLRTSSIRVVHRQQASSVSTAQMRLEVPVSLASTERNSVTLDSVRLDYLITPQGKDLERFLALLTPSKDKFEHDDDILLDTLLRQRKKGSCLRVTVEGCKTIIVDWKSLEALNSLSSEAARLSVVTKYLPEDDRPGVLSMIRIREASCQLPTTPKLGTVRLTFTELQCAHVGLPALFACAMSDISVRKSEGTALIHPLLPLVGADNLPMLMVRMVGDDIEPAVQIKLYNMCAEYSVPILLDLLDEPADSTRDEIIQELSKSVADLVLSDQGFQAPSSPAEHREEGGKTKTKVDILIRNCGIGLQPHKLFSKAYLTLTDTKTSTSLPPGSTMNVSVEVHRAGLLITDDARLERRDCRPNRVITNTATDYRVVSALTAQGYVSIASIMSARIKVALNNRQDGQPNHTDIEVSNELLLLETCADSTQTLFALFGDLTPPSPPSRQVKYLTEPMTIEDMMASFTGEPIVEKIIAPDVLFDIDTGGDSDNDLFMEASELMDGTDDLLAESELTSSLYGPVSGLLGDIDTELSQSRPPAEAAESLLEEDPFVMTVTPDDMPFSDTTLLKDLRQQFKPAVSDECVVLETYEIEDLGFDALGPELHVLGQQSRFNLPIPQQLKMKQDGEDHTVLRLRLHDTNFIWNMHDGYDWQNTRDGITSAVEKIELRTEERLARRRSSRGDQNDDESVIGDFLFNSIYIGVPSNAEAQDIRRQINRHIDDLASETESVPASALSRPTVLSTSGRPARRRHKLRLERSRSHKVAFELKGLSVDFDLFPSESEEVQSAIDIRIKSFEIFDNVPTSTWKKFLTQLPPDDGLREMSRPMIHARLSNVRTIQDYAATEMILHVSITPLRLHVDQDALDFITRFFEFKDDSAKPAAAPNDQPFLQRVEIETVDLRLDYKPKKVDYAGLRSGHTTEFMNFVILDAANIKLKHAIIYGIKGFEPLHKTLNDVWMPDVRRNQLPVVLAGLAPVRSLVNIGSGVRDVVAIPIREYKKDGRLVRSIQKGAFHFGKTTASELARLGAKVAIGTQNVLQGAEGLLSPTAASSAAGRRVSFDQGWHDVADQEEQREPRAISAYADQPLGVFAGLQSARRFLEHDLLTARDALIAVQGEVLGSDSPGAAAAAVVRHAPTVILRPVIGASRAVGTALLGVGNQIDRDNLSRMDDKYKRR